MGVDSLPGRIEHEIAELRGAFPRVESCLSALVQWNDGEQDRYSLGLDIRWPQHQTLVSGAAQASADAAVEAAFGAAREQLQSDCCRQSTKPRRSPWMSPPTS